MKTRISYLITIFAAAQLWAQPAMDNGFQLLEKGEFEAAGDFFEDVLKRHPENKTAQICYGRALGLSGGPAKANTLFANLLKKYPNDLEIQLNYNESLLWAGEFQGAKPLYRDLIRAYPANFNARLGYANTLSNLKEYQEALVQVHKALDLDPGNASALTSKKYILLGHANTKVEKQQYSEAKAILKAIFEDYPEDKETLLSLANIHLINMELDSARISYHRMATTAKDSVIALNGLALTEHLGENEKQALLLSKESLELATIMENYELLERTYNRYVQALIWNDKYSKAKSEIAQLENKYGQRPWLISLKAMLGMYTSDTKASLKQYELLLKIDSTSFDGNLGKANALFASDRIIDAYKTGIQTLEIFENQKDARSLIEKVNKKYVPTITETLSYSFDNGNNVAYSSNTELRTYFSPKLSANLSYQSRTTENTLSNASATTRLLTGGIAYKLLPKTSVEVGAGINEARFGSQRFSQPMLKAGLKLQPYRMQNLEVDYLREVQQFNAELVSRDIVMEHYGVKYHLATNFKLGWYTQLMHTEQNDGNSRQLLFSSLYYKLFKKPGIKAGVNFQYFGFSVQKPELYFSPEQYQATEVFAEARGDLFTKTSYAFTLAAGAQKIEQQASMNIIRTEARIGSELSQRWYMALYGKYSNSASATATGFTYTEMGVSLKWDLSKKPLFHKRLLNLN
ncbi:tetratricopeptide repeat protein [Poritiphilus flavus]|uniref:Tetratricopeptide repeat protein n=1 Tax=Poritiphilus flavus TaxID=2697053 RepID=A0A6L9E733_9FLAO|nr:tetratricopeptide repeat protein [Poritiphilus flavus]NAS10438.1 tetratricopeptide repeat protein [Poritiphilus flavus]